MFELVTEIPVTFVPHDLDLWAVGATLFAASTSLVVAMLAWRNGKKAVEIAEASALRDQWHRENETLRLRRLPRLEVAKAVSDALVATQYWADMLSLEWSLAVEQEVSRVLSTGANDQAEPTESETLRNAESAANAALQTALSMVNIHVEAPNNRSLEAWLGESVGGIRERLIHWRATQITVLDYSHLGINKVTEHNLDEIHRWAHGPLADAPTPEMHPSFGRK